MDRLHPLSPAATTPALASAPSITPAASSVAAAAAHASVTSPVATVAPNHAGRRQGLHRWFDGFVHVGGGAERDGESYFLGLPRVSVGAVLLPVACLERVLISVDHAGRPVWPGSAG